MKTKATKKFLSLALAVIMIMGSAVAMFAYATTPEPPATDPNAPKDYATAEDKSLLWNVDFASEHYTAHDDSTTLLPTGGQSYAWKDGAAIEYNDFRSGWRKSLVADPAGKVIKDGGNTLEISGPRSTGVEDNPETTDVDESTNLDAQSVSTTAATDHRYIGEINAYEVAGKSFTVELQAYASTNNSRTRVYFGNGSFMYFGGTDSMMPVLGLEPQAASYVIRRQSADAGRGVGKPNWVTDEAASEKYLDFKIVYSFGEVIEDVTLWSPGWLEQPANDPTADTNYYKWTGDAIPVEFAIYNVVKNGETTKDIRVLKGEFYQPAARDGIVLGIGNWDAQTKDKYYGIRDVKLYKGDTSIPFNFGFEKVYDEADWGEPLTTFDAKGLVDPAFNFANGYEWGGEGVDEANKLTIEVGGNGEIMIKNRKGAGATLGAQTPHPFAGEWNHGYYELQFSLNNTKRFKLGLLSFTTPEGQVAESLGFGFIPNMIYTAAVPEVPATPEVPDDPETPENEYQAANPGSPAQPEKIEYDTARTNYTPATLYFGYGNNFGNNQFFRNAAATHAFNASIVNWVETTIYDTYVADGEDEDTLPDDPRLVRDQGGNRANVKIAYDCENYVITLYEKVNSKWEKISSMDYSNAIEAGLIIEPVLDFHCYDDGATIDIKEMRVIKGISAVKMYTYNAGEGYTDLQVNGANAELAQSLVDAYVDHYNLGGAEIKWSIDGGKTALESFDDIYGKLNHSFVAPEEVNLVPLLTYEDMAKEIAVRGVKLSSVSEDGKYDVQFVAAIDDVELKNYKTVGFKINKVVSVAGVVVAEVNENVETDKVFTKLNSNGAAIDASAFGGKYVVAAGLKAETAAEDVQVDYVVTAYVVAQDGTVVEAEEGMTFTFIGGEYTPTAPAIVIPQA